MSQSREEIQHMDKLKAEITEALDRLAKQGIDVDSAADANATDGKPPGPEDQRSDDVRLMWELLDEKI